MPVIDVSVADKSLVEPLKEEFVGRGIVRAVESMKALQPAIGPKIN